MNRTTNIFENSSESEEEVTVRNRPVKLFKPPEDVPSIEYEDDNSEQYINDDYMEFHTSTTTNSVSVESSIINNNNNNNKSIGLSIMEKMGYRPGMSLGKDSSLGVNLEPIRVIVKSDTQGLGAPNKVILHDIDYTKYTKHRTQLQSQQLTKRKLISIMKLCFELSGDAEQYRNDNNLELVNPLWQDYVSGHIQDYEQNRLDSLIHYLRHTHNYCWYCGCEYTSKLELEKLCPGELENDHN
ncbi:uncharacterized protein RJT21DRAFT_2122 [Scheffersomyces amazonensis]|uniref:uncharacterized protein n=1 Tax=Scheffersomyces amazonensis TaxID=1078765 RepID=UPI00315DDA05